MSPPRYAILLILLFIYQSSTADTLQQITHLYQQFAQQTQQLADTAQRACVDQPKSFDPETMSSLQSTWQDTMNAWMQTASVRFGELKTTNRDLSIQFFPDKRGTIRRKVPAILQSEQALTTTQLAQQGVAAVGLPALEWLLFGDVAVSQARHCDYLIAASGLLQQQALEIANTWQQASKPSHEALVIAGLEWLELSKINRLGLPMGKLKDGRQTVVKPHLLESWRSRHSLQNLRASIKGWQSIWLNQDVGIGAVLSTKEGDLLRDLERQSSEILKAIDATPEPLYDALQGEEVMRPLQNLYFEIDVMISIVRDRVAPALDVQLGFNSLDGD